MRYVIIGGSAAGISCVESIRQADKISDITLISDETFPLYSRCLLSYFLAGSIGEDKLNFKEEDFFSENKVEAILGTAAKKINPKEREVILNNSKKIGFDKLLIATGSRSKMLDIPGISKTGVFALRTIEDARGIAARLKDARTAAVLGGGLIGLKAAYAINERGAKVKVIVKSGQVLSQILDPKAASLIQARIEKEGIVVVKGMDAKEILGKEDANGVLLDNGDRLDCGLVIIGKGVAPNTELAKEAGIEVRSGIVVNDSLETSAAGIFAAGDVAETKDIATAKFTLNALWPCAVEQGKIAGKNMAGKKEAYDGSLSMNSIEFFGLGVISMGVTKSPAGGGYEELVSFDKATDQYKKVVLKDDIICGFITVGRIENAGVYNALIKNKVNVSKIKDALLDRDFNYAKAMPVIKEYKEKFDKDEFRDSIITY